MNCKIGNEKDNTNSCIFYIYSIYNEVKTF